eukprot:4585-Heterococcus_DN1.PRE.1
MSTVNSPLQLAKVCNARQFTSPHQDHSQQMLQTHCDDTEIALVTTMLNTVSHYMANCSGALLRDVVVYTASLCITRVSERQTSRSMCDDHQCVIHQVQYCS